MKGKIAVGPNNRIILILDEYPYMCLVRDWPHNGVVAKYSYLMATRTFLEEGWWFFDRHEDALEEWVSRINTSEESNES